MRKHNNSLIRVTFIFLATGYLLLTTASTANAVNMESPRYKIQFGNVNMGGNNMSNDIDNTYKLSTTLGQTAAGEFQSTGYIVKAGFQYIHSTIPFTFSISNIKIDLGSLLPNTPSGASTVLTVSFGGAGQYAVTAAEEGPLQTMSGKSIVDTTCDGGSDTCTETLAKPWTSSARYGFGYSMRGEDIPADFINNTYFRPFPDSNASENPEEVMLSSNVTLNPTTTPPPLPTGTPRDITHQSTVFFKANVSAIQESGSYNTIINFVATPSF